jgi:hypothetical protein
MTQTQNLAVYHSAGDVQKERAALRAAKATWALHVERGGGLWPFVAAPADPAAAAEPAQPSSAHSVVAGL